MASNNGKDDEKNNQSKRLQQWHESFQSLEDDEEEEEELDDFDDLRGSRSNTNNLNRSFVDFLFDGRGSANNNSVNNHSFHLLDENEAFVTVQDIPVVSRETLSDSFIARRYPT